MIYSGLKEGDWFDAPPLLPGLDEATPLRWKVIENVTKKGTKNPDITYHSLRVQGYYEGVYLFSAEIDDFPGDSKPIWRFTK